MLRSKDQGRTPETSVEITSEFFGVQCADPVRSTWGAGFAASGSATQLSSGRIIVAAAMRTASAYTAGGKRQVNCAIYSDGGGITWLMSENSPAGGGGTYAGGYGDESKIAELPGGTLMMLTRPAGARQKLYKRTASYSYDGGRTRTKSEPHPDLPSSASNGDFIAYSSVSNGWDKNRLLCAFDVQPYTGSNGWGNVKNVPSASAGGPGYPAVFISYDDGKTWAGRCRLNGASSCASIAVLNGAASVC